MECESEAEFLNRFHNDAKLVVEAGAVYLIKIAKTPVGIHLVYSLGVWIVDVSILEAFFPCARHAIVHIDNVEIHAPVYDVVDVTSDSDVVFVDISFFIHAESARTGCAVAKLAVPPWFVGIPFGIDQI